MDGLLQAFIKQHCANEASFERGMTYFKQHRVEDATYNRDEQTFYALVRGSNSKYHIELSQHKNKLSAWCDCPAFYSYDGFCKHIVAGLFKMNEAGILNYPGANNKKNDNEFQATEQMIQLFEKQRLRMINATNHKQPIQIEYLLKSDASSPFSNGDDLLTLEIKFGVTRLYVVRKIKELLTAIMNEQTYTFTKNFSYDPGEHLILEEDRQILKLLYEISNHEKFYKHSQYDYWNMRYTDDRFLMIPPFLADNLIEKLVQRNSAFEFSEQVYKPFSFVTDSMPFSFRLHSEQETNYQLMIEQDDYNYYFQPYGYVFTEGIFYKPKPSVQEILPALVEQSVPIIKKSISIAETQIEAFITHVIPTLKKIGHLSIAEDIGEKITSEPLRASIFVDYTEEQVQAMIEYNYGDISFDPLKIADRQAITKEKIIMRDSDKEALIMEIIEHAPFKYNGRELYIDDEEDMYAFLFFILPLLEEHADIYMTSMAKSLLMTETKYTPKTTVDFRSDTNLLEVNFSMDGIEEKEIQQILQSVIEKKKYFRLANGAFVSLNEQEFAVIGELINELGLSKKEANAKLTIPAYRALQIADIVGDKQVDKTKFSKSLRQLIESLQNPENLEFELPRQINAELRDYQQIGFQWFKTLSYYRFGGILADDMGLGKTLQSIAYILSERTNEKAAEPALVICPASLIYNWEREFRHFAPSLNVVVVAGSREERNDLIEHSKDADVIITSYPLIRRDIDLYEQNQYHILILDEAQSIKNHYTQTTQAVKKIKALHRFALSGTPIENSLDELASIFDVILPGLFPSKKKFRQLSEQKLSQMVKPFILRRMKRDVLTELPEKIETVHLSELTKKQKELYLGYLENIQKEALSSIAIDGFDKSRMKILAGLTRLRQLCCHPSLFIKNYEGDCGKMEQLLELLDESLANGRRILLFSQFTSMLHLIREELDKREISYFYLDGQTDTKERLQMATEFNEGKHNVFLISLKAGGTGLNLTGADTVILYDLWWNPAVEQQAADRAHRLGQKNVVHVMKLVTKGTIEEKIHELQQKKKALVDQIIQPGETMLTTLSEEDIKELLMLN